MNRLTRILMASTIVASTIVAARGAAQAADMPSRAVAPAVPVFTQLPAVDGVNGKIEAYGGWVDSRWPWRRAHAAGGVLPSLSFPLGQQFGMQLDGILASHRGGLAGGGAGHLFWRDPGRALVGVYGSLVRVDAFGDTRARAGLEGALYFDRWTISGIVGAEWSTGSRLRVMGAIPGFYVLDLGWRRAQFFDMIDVSFYPTDDWKVSVGHRYVGGRNALALGTEALLVRAGGLGVAGFVEGRIGERDYKAALAGVRVYFGQKDKSLIQRHRQDDPPNWLKDDLFAPGAGARAGYAAIPVAAPPPSPPTCSCGPCYPVY